jgi:hypothetical protein
MDAQTREFVFRRADGRCEYCQLSQSAAPFLRFHVEHIEARQHVVDDSLDNLALACPDCNRHKGPNVATIEAATRHLVRQFHPRLDAWGDHFEFQGAVIVGRTSIGDATVRLLQMNTDERIGIRAELRLANE